MANRYKHSTILIGNDEIPIFIISLQNDSYRRSLLLEFLSENIINNYFPASDFRSQSDLELDQFMDLDKLMNNKIYNRKLTGGEIGCADSHKAIYRYMVGNNIPLALILEDDVVAMKNWKNKLEKIILELKSIKSDISYVCNIGIDYYRSVPQNIIFRSLSPLNFFKKIREVNFSKTDLWLTHSYLINLHGAKNLLHKNDRYQTTCDDWKFFYSDKILEYIFISDCIFIQNQNLDSNIREREIINNTEIDKNVIFLLFIKVLAFIKTILNKIDPRNWTLIKI